MIIHFSSTEEADNFLLQALTTVMMVSTVVQVIHNSISFPAGENRPLHVQDSAACK